MAVTPVQFAPNLTPWRPSSTEPAKVSLTERDSPGIPK